jgi:hypothetical protein
MRYFIWRGRQKLAEWTPGDGDVLTLWSGTRVREQEALETVVVVRERTARERYLKYWGTDA